MNDLNDASSKFISEAQLTLQRAPTSGAREKMIRS